MISAFFKPQNASNNALEVTFKYLDHNCYGKGKNISRTGGILGHQNTVPVS